MKSLLLSSFLLAGIVSTTPALADFNSTGDGIFGHDYRIERTVKPDLRDLSIGYSDTARQERTGSGKAVVDQPRRERSVPRATVKTVREEKVDIRR